MTAGQTLVCAALKKTLPEEAKERALSSSELILYSYNY